MNTKIIIILSLLFSLGSFAQIEDDIKNESDELKEKLSKLRELEPDDYTNNIDSFRVSVEKYINYKRKVCSGEFSSIILDESSSAKAEVKKKKLSKDEKRVCFAELKSLQIIFINNMFIARKKFLKSVYSRALNELEKSREASLKNLKKRFKKRKF
jgi:hypothetical protein